MSSKLAWYIVKRVFLAIFTIFLIITITFFAVRAIPGNPFIGEKMPSQAVIDALNKKHGLDKPLWEQYFIYLGNVLHGDFGDSAKYIGKPVMELIGECFSYSAKIGLSAASLAIIIGLTFGSIAAVFHNKLIDRVIMVFTSALVALPSFVIATICLLLFCMTWNIFPPNGTTTAGLILPVVSLLLYPMSYITRLTRSSMLDVLGQDYIRTARAKGVSNVKVIFKHALKNAVTPVITYVGPMIAFILTGSLVVEQVFRVPGLGRFFVSSVTDRDYPMVMGTTIFLATLMVLMTLISDILYKIVDPRVDLK